MHRTSVFRHYHSTFQSLFGGLTLLLIVASTVRAQAPGDQDNTFATGPASNAPVRALALQSNGQVLVGGGFSTFRGAARNTVARLNPDGSLDAFNPGLAISGYNGGSPTVYALALQSDGQVIAAGQFNVLNQTAGGGVARLKTDGSLDTTFNVGSGVLDNGGEVGEARVVAVLANKQILVGGAFTSFDGVPSPCLVRLNPDGKVDTTFNAGGAGIAVNGYGNGVQAIVVLANGQILIGGGFSSYNGVAEGGVARLNADGTIDTNFAVGTGADYFVSALAAQGDGKVLAGGGFNSFDGATIASHLVRLNTDGSLDTGYSPDVGDLFIENIDAVLIQPDSTVLIGGDFRIDDGLVTEPGQGVARLLADGTLDTSFDGTNSVAEGVALALQADGKALVASDSDTALVGGVTGDALRVYDLSFTPTATVVSGVKKVSESGSQGPATFIVTLSSAPSVKTKVSYTIKGSAVKGADYKPLTGKVKFKPGVTSKTITVTPIDRGITSNGAVSIKLILTPGTGYNVGAPFGAKDKILDDR